MSNDFILNNTCAIETEWYWFGELKKEDFGVFEVSFVYLVCTKILKKLEFLPKLNITINACFSLNIV